MTIRSASNYSHAAAQVALRGVVDAVNAGASLTTVGVVAAAGSTQGGAAALAGGYNAVTGADDAKGVVLPTWAANLVVVVINTVSNKKLLVYPATGADINGGSANAAFTMGSARAGAFIATTTGHWFVDGLEAALPTVTELNLLSGAGTGGTPVASKAQVADSHQNIGAVKATSIAIGTSGSETAVTATAAELNHTAGTAAVLANGAAAVTHLADLGNAATGTEIATFANALRTALITFKIMAAA